MECRSLSSLYFLPAIPQIGGRYPFNIFAIKHAGLEIDKIRREGFVHLNSRLGMFPKRNHFEIRGAVVNILRGGNRHHRKLPSGISPGDFVVLHIFRFYFKVRRRGDLIPFLLLYQVCWYGNQFFGCVRNFIRLCIR